MLWIVQIVYHVGRDVDAQPFGECHNAPAGDSSLLADVLFSFFTARIDYRLAMGEPNAQRSSQLFERQ
jgi:hypothetical protein